MHIKQIRMSGFRAYKNNTCPERFSPGVNGLVGKNGSGKSTVVQAIMFVFNEADDRSKQANINDDKSRTEQTAAWVEITLDNSDDRLPGYGEEVTIKRTVGLKKNEYHINGVHKTKEEVVNTLENAGFSRANPYYYVPQGKIRDFMDMTPAKRLEMLKEIAGAVTFEERRQSSQKELERTELDRQEIQRDLDKIEEQLKGLDADTAQLREYMEVDKERRILEYCILRKSLSDSQARLDELRRKFAAAQEGGASERERDLKERLRETEEKLAAIQADVSRSEQARRGASDAAREAGARVAELESDERDAREGAKEAAQQARERERALRDSKKRLEKTRSDAEAKAAELEEAAKAQGEAETRSKGLEKRLAPLLSKHNFKSRKERDAALRKESAETEESLKRTTAAVEAKKAELARMRSALEEKTAEVEEKGAALAEKEEAGRGVRKGAEERRAEQAQLIDERKELERQSQELLSQIAALEAEKQQAQNRFTRAVPTHLVRGWKAVNEIVRTHTIQGVHGAVIELFNCKPIYNAAVEQVAGNALFNVVVETDAVATQITEHLLRTRAGRVTFLPLNRLVVDPPVQPPSKNEMSLLKVLSLRDGTKFEKPFTQIFGKHLLCRDLDSAVEVAKTHRVNTVTMDGDCAHKKGSLEGGYEGGSSRRIEAFRAQQEKQDAIDARTAERDKLTARAEELRRLADQKGSEASKLESSAEANRRDVSSLSSELKYEQKALATLQQSEAAAAKYIRDQEAARAALAERLSELTKELQTELPAALSGAEQGQMDELLARKSAAEKDLHELRTKRDDLEVDHAALQKRLAKQEEDVKGLEAEIAELKQQQDEGASESRSRRLAEAREAAKAAQGRAAEAEAAVAALQQQAAALGKEAGKLRKDAEEAADEAAAQQATVDEFRVHEGLQLRKIEEYTRKIRELGALPAEAHALHTGASLKQLTQSLEKVRTSLKKFGTVNKRARDQLQQFTEQRDIIRRKLGEVEKSRSAILDMMSTLEGRKDELLERTFKQIAKNLKTVFRELVDGGDIEFVMKTAARGAAGAGGKKRARAELTDDEEDADAEETNARGARGGAAAGGSTAGGHVYVGAQIRAKFPRQDTWQDLTPLSGGQKSIIALAFIFAIQRCDPSPFYLFDEVDDSLDPMYKTAVARLVRTQADAGVQFFTVTFSKQLVEVCDKVYGSRIKKGKKESEIECITKEAALKFVEAEEQQQIRQMRGARGGGGGDEDDGEYEDGGEGGSNAAGGEDEDMEDGEEYDVDA